MGITLAKKALVNGRYSLYLDCCVNGVRRKEYLGIILDAPTTKAARTGNKMKLHLATLVRLKQEMNLLHAKYLGQLPGFQEMVMTPKEELPSPDFFKIAKNFLTLYTRKDKRLVQAVFEQLRKFHGKANLPIRQITPSFCTRFLDFLYEQLRGSTPINYFKKFKMCLNYCVDEHFIEKSPADRVRLSQYNEVTKEILSNEEISRLALTPCRSKEVKRAFLFSCYSGLRWCDVQALTYQNLDMPSRRLTLIQKKVATHSTNPVLHLNLSASALQLLSMKNGRPDDRVFQLPSHSYGLRVLNDWMRKAGITKHISFHCARHTFITHIMATGASIKTAASLAGHSTTRHTEKYIHIIDEAKQRAVDSLPPLPEQLN